jgi:ribonucleoside-diphosphate reductase alpha chain
MITQILKKHSHDLNNIDLSILDLNKYSMISTDVPKDVYDSLAETCAYNSVIHPEWATLAGRLKLQSLKFNTGKTFSETTVLAKGLLNSDYYNYVMENKNILDDIIIESRDDNIDWFGICTGIKSYLMKVGKNVVETPQYMFLRVAVWIWRGDIEKIKEMYDDLSLHNYMHATPTLFNSGYVRPQLSSCFLMTVGDDMEKISKSWHDVAMISKNSGGLGIDISDIRHSGIGNGSNAINANTSSGTVPLIKVLNSIVSYVDQGGKRKGSAAIYLSDYHIDIYEFLELRKNTGSESVRARDLFYALWVSDLFMKRVEKDEMWSLFCPNIAKGLNNVWGEEFEKMYLQYEREEKYDRQVSARDLWTAIHLAQVETGMPYIMFKDSCNRKSNQQNLGTIRCSNLCCEILEYTSKDEIANCNLANIVLNSCVKKLTNGKALFDFSKLERVSRALVRNLNQVIDINYYIKEVPQIKNSNLKHRPIGIGVQGLADVFAMMDLEWDSAEAKKLNLLIFETIYYGAVSESIMISKERLINKNTKLVKLKREWKELVDYHGKNPTMDDANRILKSIHETENIEINYSSFENSPTSKGFLQFDLWEKERLMKENNINGEDISLDVVRDAFKKSKYNSSRYDWDKVRDNLKAYGLRNSLLVALMPTASTAHLIGNNECFEPFTSCIFARTVLSGQFMCVNKYMVKDLQDELFGDIWSNGKIANDILLDNGCLTNLNIKNYIKNPTPQQSERFNFLKRKYMTVYEIPMKVLAEMAIDRGRFVCQTQSFNCFMKDPTYQQMTSYLFYQWKNGAKTGMYYLRSNPATNAIKVALDTSTKSKKDIIKEYTCTDEVCIVCQ